MSMRRSAGQRWAERDELVRRFVSYGHSHGAWNDEAGYVEGENVAIEYRYSENQPDRLRALANDLIARNVARVASR